MSINVVVISGMYHIYQQRLIEAKKLKNDELMRTLETSLNRDIRATAGEPEFCYEMSARIRKQNKSKSCFVKAPVNVFESVLKLVTKKSFDFKATKLAKSCDRTDQGGLAGQGFRAMGEYGLSQHNLKSSPFERPGSVTIDTKFVNLLLGDNVRLKNNRALKIHLAAFGPLTIAFSMNPILANPPMDAEIVNGRYLYDPPADINHQPQRNAATPALHYYTCFGWMDHDGITYFGIRNSHGKTYGKNGDIWFSINNHLGPHFYDFDCITAIWSNCFDPYFCAKHADYDAYELFQNEFIEECKNAFNQ